MQELRHTKERIWNSIKEKQEVYLEYGTQFRHAISSIHDNLTKLTYGQYIYSVASKPEFCQAALENFLEISILNCVSTRTHIPK